MVFYQELRGQGLTGPIGDETVSTLRLHLDVGAARGLQGQDVGPVGGLVHLLPETPALQRASKEPPTWERAGRCPWDVTQRCHRTSGNITHPQFKVFKLSEFVKLWFNKTFGLARSAFVCFLRTWSAAARAPARACWCLSCRR